MSKLFVDIDFAEIKENNTRRIELVSIGIVGDDGKEYYAINEQASWLYILTHTESFYNMHPNIVAQTSHIAVFVSTDSFKDYSVIVKEVTDFIDQYREPELWLFYDAINSVVVNNLMTAGEHELCPTNSIYVKLRNKNINTKNLPRYHGDLSTTLDNAKWNRLAYNFIERQA